jgi:hypothetical protein
MRSAGARSITVGLNPSCVSQYARIGPATPAPEIRMFGFLAGMNDSQIQYGDRVAAVG